MRSPPDDDLYKDYREYIVENLIYCQEWDWITPTFSSTVDAVCKKHRLQPYAVKPVLSMLISEGYLIQREQTLGPNRRTRALFLNMEKITEAGWYSQGSPE